MQRWSAWCLMETYSPLAVITVMIRRRIAPFPLTVALCLRVCARCITSTASSMRSSRRENNKLSRDLYMPLRMETDISGEVVILYCSGRLVFGDETAAFRERINHILSGTAQIVVNFRGIEYVEG